MSRIFKTFLENETAVRRIFTRYFRQREDIEDLTQEIFLRCFAAEMKTDIVDPKAFLLRSAKNLAFSERKKKSRTTTDYVEDSGGLEVLVDEHGVSPESQLDSQRKLAALARALAQLPPQYRETFMMRKMGQLKLSQIATRLDLSVSMVQKRIATALVMCDASLRREGYDPAEFGRLGSTKPQAGDKDAQVLSLKSERAGNKDDS